MGVCHVAHICVYQYRKKNVHTDIYLLPWTTCVVYLKNYVIGSLVSGTFLHVALIYYIGVLGASEKGTSGQPS